MRSRRHLPRQVGHMSRGYLYLQMPQTRGALNAAIKKTTSPVALTLHRTPNHNQKHKIHSTIIMQRAAVKNKKLVAQTTSTRTHKICKMCASQPAEVGTLHSSDSQQLVSIKIKPSTASASSNSESKSKSNPLHLFLHAAGKLWVCLESRQQTAKVTSHCTLRFLTRLPPDSMSHGRKGWCTEFLRPTDIYIYMYRMNVWDWLALLFQYSEGAAIKNSSLPWKR